MTLTSVVTGCAGFVGSHLTERLLAEGHRVIGVDCFTDYYSREVKLSNLAAALQHPNFRLIEADILALDWTALLPGVTFLFHQAAQAGVRASWGLSFGHYTRHNIDATQVLLEAARSTPGLRRFVFASTSSVYGDAETYPTPETLAPRPVSPYGITKLAAERLGQLYWRNFGVPFVALRYFTVYGPRQRPDMGFHKFIRAALDRRPLEIYGDGLQTRDFTYVEDIVEANLLAARCPGPIEGEVFNIGGGSRVALNVVLELIAHLSGESLHLAMQPRQPGDARHTAADIQKANHVLGYHPRRTLRTGLQHQIAWMQRQMAATVAP